MPDRAPVYELPYALLNPDVDITLLQQDYRTLMQVVPPVDIVLTDPPYIGYGGMLSLEASGVLPTQPLETIWPVWSFMWQWFPLLLSRVRRALWFTCDYRYLPFYRAGVPAALTIQDWPLPQSEACLVHVGPRPVACPSDKAMALFRCGTDSPEAFWAGLLAATPGGPPGLVLDPFCGTGSGLRAAVRAGYRVVGIEENAEVFAALQVAMRPLTMGHSRHGRPIGLYSGLAGPGQET